MKETFELGTTLDTPSLARQVVRNVLDRWGMGVLVEDAVLIASELVANAVVHAAGAIRLTTLVAGEGSAYVRIEVTDGANRPPVRANSPEDALSGRGLNIVFDLAAAWGSTAVPAGWGKTVWAERDERQTRARQRERRRTDR